MLIVDMEATRFEGGGGKTSRGCGPNGKLAGRATPGERLRGHRGARPIRPGRTPGPILSNEHPVNIWRFLLSEPDAGVENMALDEALVARARRTGECVLRVYAWSRPTLSLGRHQVARGVFDGPQVGAAGVEVVRRFTGGRALLHHREITYSATGPLEPGQSLRGWYDTVNGLLVHALRALGVDARPAAPETRMPPPGSAPCFERPAAGEIVVGGRKLVGSALVREHDAVLQHGSILVDDDQPLVAHLAAVPVPRALPAATLREALGRAPGLAEVAQALVDALRVRSDRGASPLPADPRLDQELVTARARYTSDAWTWRR
jgi:lipoate-protein ligase A